MTLRSPVSAETFLHRVCRQALPRTPPKEELAIAKRMPEKADEPLSVDDVRVGEPVLLPILRQISRSVRWNKRVARKRLLSVREQNHHSETGDESRQELQRRRLLASV